MEMPKPGPEHAKLARLVGTWVGPETLHPSPWDPEQRTAEGRFEMAMTCGGFFLRCDYTETRDGGETYAGIGMYGYDVKAQRYAMHWFDSMGGSYERPALGDFEGDALRYTNQGPHGHARYGYVLVNDHEMTFSIETSPDGETWKPFMDGRYQRMDASV